jgi:hypothetical protein
MANNNHLVRFACFYLTIPYIKSTPGKYMTTELSIMSPRHSFIGGILMPVLANPKIELYHKVSVLQQNSVRRPRIIYHSESMRAPSFIFLSLILIS